MRGDLDEAVFKAFKAVGVGVLAASGYANTDIGVTLMRKAFHADTGPLTRLSDPPAERQALRNWMWVCARSVEAKQPINIYAYAARSADRWLFDLHLGEKGAISCFGLQVPHVYVPISEIFISVYNECKKILGETGAQSGRAMRSH
jgi:hypothetical protein